MKTFRIGVKELAFHLYSDGDLTNEFSFNRALMEGTKAHQYLQSKYNKESLSEVFVSMERAVAGSQFLITGYMDGLIKEEDTILIEEIKSTSLSLLEIEEGYHPEYLAQLKFYAAIYCVTNALDHIDTRLTYIQIKKYEIKKFYYSYKREELEFFLDQSLREYAAWINLLETNKEKRRSSIDACTFPFPQYRIGQREMMKAVYATMLNQGILYASAPTGIGKTASTLFSTIKTMKEDQEKIFYTTSKSVLKDLALDAMNLFAQHGLSMKTIVLTAKMKSCLHQTETCDTRDCPYAEGFFGRLRYATEDIYANHSLFTFGLMQEYAQKYQICPFEFSLHLSLFCDVIVCDYNYVFDPQSHLIRYFDDETYQAKILVDEAHNMVARSKDMYSSTINSELLLRLKKLLKGLKPNIQTTLKKLKQWIDQLEESFLKVDTKELCLEKIDPNFLTICVELYNKLIDLFTENQEFPNRGEAIDIFFELKHFLLLSDYFDESRRFIIYQKEKGYDFHILCFNAAKNILETIQNSTKGCIFFSATLSPLQYHKELITQNVGDHILLSSPFPKENLGLVVLNHISTYYQHRSQTIPALVSCILTMIQKKSGNYIVFFPSYAYLEMVYQALPMLDSELLVQSAYFTEAERQSMIARFEEPHAPKLGLFVLGGMFAEGVDYVGDALSGVMVVGVGIPQISFEQELLKEYFQGLYQQDGYHYAYTYPGFNKIVQAAGRVIRTPEDKGIVILVDPRITSSLYQKMMPRHWGHRVHCRTQEELDAYLTDFWEK